jgi:ParB-like chromosome segregation protein Spo0J
MSKDPIDNIIWKPARELWANAWNPNVVFNQELKLLEEGIILLGWLQPILVNPDWMIIDGFHRVQLSISSPRLQQIYAEEVPCAVVDLSIPDAMMMTIRINRAKGQHVAFKMSDLVKTLVEEYQVTQEEMQQKMGMTKSEVALLYDGTLIKRKELQTREYSRAWIPVETKFLSQEERDQLEADRKV